MILVVLFFSVRALVLIGTRQLIILAERWYVGKGVIEYFLGDKPSAWIYNATKGTVGWNNQ